jgi:hypothetical protein
LGGPFIAHGIGLPGAKNKGTERILFHGLDGDSPDPLLYEEGENGADAI